MYNPIQFIKDVLDLVKTPPGKPLYALELTRINIAVLQPLQGPSRMDPYLNIGDFLVEFETIYTVVPAKEFNKKYEFTEPRNLTSSELTMTPIREIQSV